MSCATACLFALLPLTSTLLSLPLPALLLVGCYVAHCFSSSFYLWILTLLPLLIPLLRHPLLSLCWLYHHLLLHRLFLSTRLLSSLDALLPHLARALRPPPHHCLVDCFHWGLLHSRCHFSACLKCKGDRGTRTSLSLVRMGRGCNGWSQKRENMGTTMNLWCFVLVLHQGLQPPATPPPTIAG